MTNSDAQNHPHDPGGDSPDGTATQLLLELYLDGSLDEAQKARFEAELARSPELRAALELEQRIAGSLRRQFAPPVSSQAPASTRASVPRAASVAGRVPAFSLRRVGLAAAACLLIGVGVLAMTFYNAMHSSPQRVRPTLAAVYTTTIASGFVPDEVCTTDEAFAGWMKERFGTALAPSRAQAGVEFVGWSYSGAISPYTGVLLARVEGKPVLVFIDTLEQEKKFGPPESALDTAKAARATSVAQPRGTWNRGQPEPAAQPGSTSKPDGNDRCSSTTAEPLRMHRSELAGLVFYEVSGFGESRIVNQLVPR